MKKMLEKYLPNDLIYRKKWGFPAPIATWLKGDLAPLITTYLDPKRLLKQGMFDESTVSKLVHDFKQGADYHYKRVWSLIVFQMWFDKYIDNKL